MTISVRGTGVPAVDAANIAAAVRIAEGDRIDMLGSFILADTVAVGGTAHISGCGATITQTAWRTAALTVDSASGVTLDGLTIVGRGDDYANDDLAGGGSGVHIKGSSCGVSVTDCTITNCTGGGVYFERGASHVTVERCTIIGPGAAAITGTDCAYGAGVAAVNAQGQGVTDDPIGCWSVRNCDISEYAQGILTADNIADVQITGNRIHDIVGQHGMYLGAAQRLVVANNIVRGCGLNGMKVQIGSDAGIDSTELVISGNIVTDVSLYGIHLINSGDTAALTRRAEVVANIVTGAASDGINVQDCTDVTVMGNLITRARKGVYAENVQQITIQANRAVACVQQGIHVKMAGDYEVRDNNVTDCATGRVDGQQSGVLVEADCTEGFIDRNVVRDSAGNMTNGFIHAPTGDATHTYRDNHVGGGTQEAYRFAPGARLRDFSRNTAAGGHGFIRNMPTVV